LRRRHLNEKVDAGQRRTTDAAPLHKLSWPSARWANQYYSYSSPKVTSNIYTELCKYCNLCKGTTNTGMSNFETGGRIGNLENNTCSYKW